MMRKQKYLYTHFCWLIVSLLSPFILQAQSLPTTVSPGEVVGSGLTVYNSIIWENVFESAEPSNGSHNLVSEDPLFVSATEFFLKNTSPAIGVGENSINSLGVDIAGVPHAGNINIGAYENNAKYTITIDAPGILEGTLAIYKGTTLISDGAELAAGTELKVIVIPVDGYRLEKLTANGGVIKNGDVYILSANTTFKAELIQGNGRPVAYATAKSGSGKFNVYNTIIYGNADDYGTYSLDKTNMVANPGFASVTEFALNPASPALGKGDASKLSVGSVDLAGMDILVSGTNASIDLGAYQSATFTLGWNANLPEGGTLEVFYLKENEAKQKVREPATDNGGRYPATTVVVKATLSAGYMLQEIKANDQVLTVTKGETSFELGVNTVITATFRSFSGDTKTATVYQPTGSTLTLKNNIVYGNITVTDEGTVKSNTFTESPVPTNVVDAQNNLDGDDPLFYSKTDFRLQNGSPVIDKGDNSVVTVDMKDLGGNDRVYGTVDLGAYESKEELVYVVTFGWTDLKDKYGKVYASVEVKTANGTTITSGDKVPAGSEINLTYTILNTDNYEWFGQVGLTGVGTNYLPEGVVSFTLEEDIRISVPIRLKKYVVTYETTNGGVKVYSGSTLIPSGEEVSYETLLTIQPTADEYHKLAFVAVNGQHIEGAETAGGYIVTVNSETTITVNCIPIYELDDDGEPIVKPGGDPNDPNDWVLFSPKGLITWDALNGVVAVTNTDNNSVVQAGDLLPAGTNIHVEITPAAISGYKLVLVELNGQSYPYTSFDWEIPAMENNAVASTFIGVRYEVETDPIPPVTPGVSYQVTTGVTGNGTLTIKNGNTIVQSGQSVTSGTVLTLEAVPATGYVLSSLTVNGKLALSGGEITVLEATSIMAFFDKEQDPSQPTPDPDLEKQVYVTVVGNGAVTLQDGITAVMIESGDWVDNNTSILLTATASTAYELTSLQVNGMDVANGQSFIVTTTTNVVAVFSRKGETPTPPVTPPVGPSETEYVTLTIGGGLPSGITMNPGAGSYQIAKGSNQVLRLTVDGRYDGQYIYLKVNDRYVLLREPGTTRDLTYTLVNITGGMSIGVVVSQTPDPNPSSNAEIENGTRIWTESGQVCIQTEAAGSVHIITFNGRIIKQQNLSAGETRIALPDGFYIVVLSDGTTAKVAVRNF